MTSHTTRRLPESIPQKTIFGPQKNIFRESTSTVLQAHENTFQPNIGDYGPNAICLRLSGSLGPFSYGTSDPNTSEQMGFVQCTPGILLQVTFVCLQNSRGSLSRTTFFEVDRTFSSHGFREPSSTFFDQLQRAASESASRFL